MEIAEITIARSPSCQLSFFSCQKSSIFKANVRNGVRIAPERHFNAGDAIQSELETHDCGKCWCIDIVVVCVIVLFGIIRKE
jgi:hypothetical protein